jgi:putative nucleotidyltransferase with HDIG domain
MSTPVSIRLAEVVAALSLATDLGMGQPVEFALRSSILAMRLGDALGYSDDVLREVYYQSLLRYIGCNVETHLLAGVVGDEFAFRRDFAMIDNGNTLTVIKLMLRYMQQVNANTAPIAMAKSLAHGLMTIPQIKASVAGHCEVAQRLAVRLGFGSNIVRALGQLFERWDGKGAPNGLKGEAIASAVLVVTLAQDTLLFSRLGGVNAAMSIARERRGTIYAPYIVDRFCQHAAQLLTGLEDEPSWKTVVDLEPGEHQWLNDNQFDTACQAMADFVDIKSPATLNHSSHVADLAGLAAQQAKLPPADVAAVRRAGWLHDIGKTGISANILEKSGALSEQEWERVRMHPYYAERILSHAESLAHLGTLCALHHERLDGSGYHRGLPAIMIPVLARILSAANAYWALLQNRPYRAALSPDEAADVLNRDVQAGKLDGDAVHAVLTAAGHQSPRRTEIARLSERELEVLRLLARGLTTRQIAVALAISPKTADHHIQHIYTKIGASTRAGATLFVMEHSLLN